jgi:hypothetical protein
MSRTCRGFGKTVFLRQYHPLAGSTTATAAGADTAAGATAGDTTATSANTKLPSVQKSPYPTFGLRTAVGQVEPVPVMTDPIVQVNNRLPLYIIQTSLYETSSSS